MSIYKLPSTIITDVCLSAFFTKEIIDAQEFFSISFMGKEYREALNYCGSHSGRDTDKVANAGLTWN